MGHFGTSHRSRFVHAVAFVASRLPCSIPPLYLTVALRIFQRKRATTCDKKTITPGSSPGVVRNHFPSRPDYFMFLTYFSGSFLNSSMQSGQQKPMVLPLYRYVPPFAMSISFSCSTAQNLLTGFADA